MSDSKKYIITHNITAQKFHNIMLGIIDGFIMPSLAIQPLDDTFNHSRLTEDFGSLVFVAEPKVFLPEHNEYSFVYSDDVFSVEFPTLKNHFNKTEYTDKQLSHHIIQSLNKIFEFGNGFFSSKIENVVSNAIMDNSVALFENPLSYFRVYLDESTTTINSMLLPFVECELTKCGYSPQEYLVTNRDAFSDGLDFLKNDVLLKGCSIELTDDEIFEYLDKLKPLVNKIFQGDDLANFFMLIRGFRQMTHLSNSEARLVSLHMLDGLDDYFDGLTNIDSYVKSMFLELALIQEYPDLINPLSSLKRIEQVVFKDDKLVSSLRSSLYQMSNMMFEKEYLSTSYQFYRDEWKSVHNDANLTQLIYQEMSDRVSKQDIDYSVDFRLTHVNRNDFYDSSIRNVVGIGELNAFFARELMNEKDILQQLSKLSAYKASLINEWKQKNGAHAIGGPNDGIDDFAQGIIEDIAFDYDLSTDNVELLLNAYRHHMMFDDKEILDGIMDKCEICEFELDKIVAEYEDSPKSPYIEVKYNNIIPVAEFSHYFSDVLIPDLHLYDDIAQWLSNRKINVVRYNPSSMDDLNKKLEKTQRKNKQDNVIKHRLAR